MTVARKLLVMLVFVALAPLCIFALSALREHERALRAELAALHQKTAEHGARAASRALESAQRALHGLATAIPWRALSEEERAGALVLVYDLLDDIAIASLLDEHGRGVGDSVFRDRGAGLHPVASEATLAAFARALPFPSARTAPAVGPPIELPGEAPLVAIGIPITGSDGARWGLAVALSLRDVCEEISRASPRGVMSRLDSASGRGLCGTRAATSDVLTATSRTAEGWIVTAEQPRITAFASLHRVRVQSLVWLALGAIAAVVAGVVLAQSLQRPLRALMRGAESLARGELAHRVTVASRDELGALAGAFNRMGDEIEKQDAEIRAWNRELQARVEARTKELRDAQEQLLQSRKLGAVAALAAGVAHEINNPLTGVVGLTQVLLAKDKHDDKTRKSLSSIEREALRIRDIVERLGKLAQASVSDATRVAIADLVEAALAQHAEAIAARDLVVERAFAPEVPPVLGNAEQLQHALAQLVDNAVRALPRGGRLRCAIRTIEDDAVVLEVHDTGRGIPADVIDRVFEPFFTTKDDWRGAGLGLAIVHRIVEAHQGMIRAASTVGVGTTMTITLPAAQRTAHLV